MIIDSKGKLFGKISIVDILIVVIVLAGIGGLVYKLNSSKTLSPFGKGNDTIQISFYHDEIQDYVAKSVKDGATVIDPQKNIEFGKVREIKTDKAVSITTNDKGEFVQTSKPGYNSILVTVEGKGTYSEKGVTFGTEKYYIGKTLEVRFGNTAIFMRVYNIKKVGE